LAKTRDKWLREHPKAVAPVLSSAEQEQVRGSEADVAIAEQALTAQQERIAQFEKTMPKESHAQFVGAMDLGRMVQAGAATNKPEMDLAKQQLESLRAQEKRMQESVQELKGISQTLKDKLGLG